MGQLIHTKTTFLIEQVNASFTINLPIAVCSDLKQAVAWAIVRLDEHRPIVVDVQGKHASIDQWEDHMYAGIYIVPQFPAHLDHIPLQLRVRAIEELTLS